MKHVKNFFKYNFITGFLILVPIGATFTLLKWIINKSDQIWNLVPPVARPETYLGFEIPGLGLIIAFLIIVFIGLLGRIYIVKFFIKMGEHLIEKIPVVSSVYSGLKQLMDTVFISAGKKDGRKVVMVEFPRKGVYSIAFLTSTAKGEVQTKTAQKVVNLFVPTTPNPTSGFLIMVPEEDVTPLDMSVEEAFKLIVSGGIVSPPHP